MERLYRFALSSLLVLGFLGAVASAADQNETLPAAPDKRALISLIRDVKIAQEANAINNNTWTQDVSDINENGLSRVEALLTEEESHFNNHAHD